MVKYTKEELDKVFDVDFEKAVNGAKELIGNDSLLPQAEEVIIEMCFQLGKTGVSKFKNMWAYLDDGDYVAAGDETTPSSSIIRASSASAVSARILTCSAVEGLLPFSTRASAAGLAPKVPSSFFI